MVVKILFFGLFTFTADAVALTYDSGSESYSSFHWPVDSRLNHQVAGIPVVARVRVCKRKEGERVSVKAGGEGSFCLRFCGFHLVCLI